MQMVLIGEYIKQRRKELHLTQEKVCDGICDPTTLSRIENGCQVPSKTKLNALLQRLGLPDSRYYAIVSKNELEIEALKKEIVGCSITHRAQEGLEKIAELEKKIDENDALTKQFVLRSKALLNRLLGKMSSQEQLAVLIQAIRLTIPSFSLDEINHYLYTFEEIKILNQIALCYSDMEQRIKALEIYMQLLKYIRNHYEEIIAEGNGIYPMVLFNYSGELGRAKHFSEGLQVCKEGQEICIKYGHYQFLPGFIANMAECCFFLNEIEKSKGLYFQAYYMYQALGNQIALNAVKIEVKKYLGIDLPD